MRGIVAGRLRPSPQDGRSASDIECLHRLTEEGRASEVGVQEDDLEVRSSSRQDEPGEATAAAEV
jgi:hypothetical protein